MAFNAATLTRTDSAPNGTAGAGRAGQTAFFRYIHATDTNANMIAAGYFDGARAQLQKGDVITLIAAIGGTPTLDHCVVTAVPAAPGNITVGRETDA